MLVLGIDGRNHRLTLTNNQRETCSSLHKRASDLLKKLFPCERIFEEVILPGTKLTSKPLTADFIIPKQKLVVEVHGEQHFKYNLFFFSNKMEFFKAQSRDRDKKEWCEVNDFHIIELIYSESIEEWKKKIQSF